MRLQGDSGLARVQLASAHKLSRRPVLLVLHLKRELLLLSGAGADIWRVRDRRDLSVVCDRRVEGQRWGFRYEKTGLAGCSLLNHERLVEPVPLPRSFLVY